MSFIYYKFYVYIFDQHPVYNKQLNKSAAWHISSPIFPSDGSKW